MKWLLLFCFSSAFIFTAAQNPNRKPDTKPIKKTELPPIAVYVGYLTVWVNGEEKAKPGKKTILVGDDYIVYNLVTNPSTGVSKGDTFRLSGINTKGIRDKAAEFENTAYKQPDIGCDSLKKICYKNRYGTSTSAVNIFWGDVFSNFTGINQQVKIDAENYTEVKQRSSSLLMTRGWVYDCVTGVFSLQVFYQFMQTTGNAQQKISYQKTIKEWKMCD